MDVTVLTIKDGDFEVLATSGDLHLGGEDFDSASVRPEILLLHGARHECDSQIPSDNVLEYFADIFKKKHGVDLVLRKSHCNTWVFYCMSSRKLVALPNADKRALQKLRRETERAKRELSTQLQVRVEIEAIVDKIDFGETLTRAKFEDLNLHLFKMSLEPVKRVLADAKLKPTDVDDVVIVGGSSRIPKVQQLLRDFFNLTSFNNGISPDEAIAYGSAIQGGVLSGVAKAAGTGMALTLVDITPVSLGLMTLGDVMTGVIVRNSRIPVTRTKAVSTAEDGQTTAKINVLAGEDPIASNNELLGSFSLVDIP